MLFRSCRRCLRSWRWLEGGEGGEWLPQRLSSRFCNHHLVRNSLGLLESLGERTGLGAATQPPASQPLVPPLRGADRPAISYIAFISYSPRALPVPSAPVPAVQLHQRPVRRSPDALPSPFSIKLVHAVHGLPGVRVCCSRMGWRPWAGGSLVVEFRVRSGDRDETSVDRCLRCRPRSAAGDSNTY